MKTNYKYLLLILVISFTFQSCTKDDEPEPPYAFFTITPDKGYVGTEFTFNTSKSRTNDSDCSSFQYKWDWDGDGNWDTSFSDKVISRHVYTEAGEYNPTLEIMVCNGWTNSFSVTLVVKDTLLP